MDSIRKLRIKHEDGTYSSSIPIGASSDDIFMTSGGTLTDSMSDVEEAIIALDKVNGTQTESINELVKSVSSNTSAIEKQKDVNEKQEIKMENFEKALAQEKVYVFDNVYAMKNANNLKAGMYCITKGYYTPNDGGKGEYLIRTKTDNDIDDGGSIHELLNNLVAELIIKNCVNAEQFGAYGDGEHDDTESLNALFKKGFSIVLKKRVYVITDNIYIKNNEIYGNDAIINAMLHKTTSEHQIYISGSNYIKDLVFKQSVQNVALCNLSNNNKTSFINVSFIVDQVKTNGYVDLYTNNQNVFFDNCIFKVDSYNSKGVLDIGGIWIREVNTQKITQNIYLNNCFIQHNTIDECLAIWNWNGVVKNVYINSCLLEAAETCTCPHFISLDAENCNLNNSTIFGPINQNNSILKGKFFNYVNDCKIYSHTEETNGISSGNIIFKDCKIENDNSQFYLGVDTLNKFYNCEIKCNAIVDSRNIEIYDCTIFMNSETAIGTRIFIRDAIIKNSSLYVKSCKSVFENYYNDVLNLEITNSNFYIDQGNFLHLVDEKQHHIIKIFNNLIKNASIIKNSENVNGSGYIINNISDLTIPTTIEGITINNNYKI